jgi:acyl-CoA synthetase (AMP-forming)/AMP-acid ligase II
VIVAGAPFPPAARAAFTRLLPEGALFEFYGSSETGTISARPPDDDLEPGLVGRPVPGVELELRDAAGARVPTGETGEIFVRSPTLMQGYLGEPPLPPGAFVSVGDLGRLLPDGRLVLVDRLHDTIITGGVNVYPAEVERALASHPAICAAVVYGVPSDTWGQEVRALIALREDRALEPEELDAFLRERLSGPKRPKRIDVVPLERLPIGSSGKPLRRLAAAAAGK